MEFTDEYRKTMYYSSLKNSLVHQRIEMVSVTKFEDYTLEEFKEILVNKSPTAIYNIMYSTEKPCWHITRLVMPSDGGVWCYANNSANKIPRFKTWEQFYNMIKISGFQPIRF